MSDEFDFDMSFMDQFEADEEEEVTDVKDKPKKEKGGDEEADKPKRGRKPKEVVSTEKEEVVDTTTEPETEMNVKVSPNLVQKSSGSSLEYVSAAIPLDKMGEFYRAVAGLF